MFILKACAVCFTTEGKLYNLDEDGLREDFNYLARLNTNKGNGLPYFMCMLCVGHIRKFKNFQSKCQRANYILTELLNKNKQVTMKDIHAIDKNLFNLNPALSFCHSKNCFYKEIKFQWTKLNRGPNVQVKDINNFHITMVTINDGEMMEIDENPLLDHFKDEVEIQEIEYLENDGDDFKTEIPIDTQMKEDDDDNELLYFDNDIPFESDTEEVVAEHNIVNKEIADGSSLNDQYANVYFINQDEQKAVAEINRMFSNGKHRCETCDKGYNDKARLKVHKRMHEMISNYHCSICNYYYPTKHLLKVHMSKKHYQKFVCTKCPEVSFDRTIAKQHYVNSHIPRETSGDYTTPNWLKKRTPNKIVPVKSKARKIVIRKVLPPKAKKKIPSDFLKYTPVSHEEQYQLIRDRQLTKNYLESVYKCDKCYRGFREVNTMNNHLKKHDPAISGPLKCDICQLYFQNNRKMYKHMIITHLFRYTCQICDFICYNRAQAHMHYRWHKNVTYPCPHCNKVFLKSSTQLTHIRIKHPSTAICNLCGHSFVSEMGLYFHKKKTHSQEEIDLNENINPDINDELYCAECNVHFVSPSAYDVHLGSSSKHSVINLSVFPNKVSTPKSQSKSDPKKLRRTRRCKDIINNGIATATDCEACGKHLANDVQARKHYKTEHPGADFLKRYMCDVCGHTTQQYNNLLVHMRTHTNEKPYACNFCGRRFSMPSNRDRHLVVHTGERRYECQHCHRRFTQSSAVKLHIQTVHLKIPYAPWDKKNRKRRKELEANVPQPVPKYQVDNNEQYINAYISYHDDGV